MLTTTSTTRDRVYVQRHSNLSAIANQPAGRIQADVDANEGSSDQLSVTREEYESFQPLPAAPCTEID